MAVAAGDMVVAVLPLVAEERGVFLGLTAGLVRFGITPGQVVGFASVSSRGSLLGAVLATAELPG